MPAGAEFFTLVGFDFNGDAAKQLRTAALLLSIKTYTPVGYWLNMPLIELNGWLNDISELDL